MSSPVTVERIPKAGSRARFLIDELELSPHPERGFFIETYRARQRVQSAVHGGERSASTAIYFLVTEDEPTTELHRLRSDEVFHLYEGGPLQLLRLFSDGTWDDVRLGLDLRNGERPQLVIPAGTWFGTALAPGSTHCLLGCSVAPGFEFRDFELADNDELERRFPAAQHAIRRIRQVTRAPGHP